MAAPAITAVADAIVTVLTSNGFTEAERRWLPYVKLTYLADRKTVVIPKLETLTEDGARSGQDREYTLGVVIQKHVPADLEAAVATLVANVETLIAACDVEGFLRDATPADATFLDGPEFPRGVLYDPEKLLDPRIFFSALTLRYEYLE